MPKGQRNTVQQQKIDLNTVKKYIEQGYQAGWGEDYVWNDDLVILRRQILGDESKFSYVIISKSHKDVIIKEAL